MSVFIERIKIKNLLSFDEEGIDFELKPLNVLIGANASGKSNFVLSLKILVSFSQYNTRDYIQSLGGMAELRNKMRSNSLTRLLAEYALLSSNQTVVHNLEFGEKQNWFNIPFEELLVRMTGTEVSHWSPGSIGRDIVFHLQLPPGEEMENVKHNVPSFLFPEKSDPQIPVVMDGNPRGVSTGNFADRSQSALHSGQHISIQELRDKLSSCWKRGFYPVFGPVVLQTPNEAGVLQEHLDIFGSNLASYLAVLNEKMIVDHDILPKVSEVYPNVTGIGTTIKGGRVYITLKEKGNKQVTLQTRISDGVLRLIAVLSVLYQDNPPPLLCIEEPENGLHPDVIPVLAKAIKEASERTQVIVTTHSSLLISYLEPDEVVVCEKPDGKGTQVERASDKSDLSEWLKEYDLGDLWLKGVLGGTRY